MGATGIRRCEDKGFVVGNVGEKRGFHLGNVTMRMRVVEVMLWRDSMVRCCV